MIRVIRGSSRRITPRIARALLLPGLCLLILGLSEGVTLAQQTASSDWANATHVTVESDPPAPITGSDSPNGEATTRTPIQRSPQPSAGRNSTGDARATSWTWFWLPVAIAAGLWWVTRRLQSGKMRDQGLLPDGVIASLGKRAVGGGQFVQLLRIGGRVLVVTPTAEGLRTLSEIIDPQEVERLVSMCLQPQAGAGVASLCGGRPISPVVGDPATPGIPSRSERSRSTTAKMKMAPDSARTPSVLAAAASEADR